MKRIRTERLTVAEVNAKLGVDMDVGFWEALVRFIDYPELTFDKETGTIRFPGYVPFRELATEWIEGIEEGIYDIRICGRCSTYHDLDKSDGIFGRPEEQDEFICMACAEEMTAREYYEKYVDPYSQATSSR